MKQQTIIINAKQKMYNKILLSLKTFKCKYTKIPKKELLKLIHSITILFKCSIK